MHTHSPQRERHRHRFFLHWNVPKHLGLKFFRFAIHTTSYHFHPSIIVTTPTLSPLYFQPRTTSSLCNATEIDSILDEFHSPSPQRGVWEKYAGRIINFKRLILLLNEYESASIISWMSFRVEIGNLKT